MQREASDDFVHGSQLISHRRETLASSALGFFQNMRL